MRLDRRTLNRTTLRRQLLLERSGESVAGLLEHLVGMQGQNPNDPYYGMWARLEVFDPADLGGLVETGDAVRGQLMRGTIHMLTAPDYARLRPLFDALCARILGSTQYGKDTRQIDRGKLLALSRDLLAMEPRTRVDLGHLLTASFPGVPPGSLAQVATYLLPVVQAPPRGVWGRTGAAAWSIAEKQEPDPGEMQSGLEDLVLRYLRAFGPASVADMRNWSGLSGLRAVVDRLRDRLVIHTDERSTELLDIPEGVIVDASLPAPPRLLPEYDNVLLGHADRSRFFDDGGPVPPGWIGNVLIDGVYAGSWTIDKGSLSITLGRKVTSRQKREVSEEAERLVLSSSGGDGHHPLKLSVTS